MNDTSFSCAPLIKEIGRGAQGARALPRETAAALYGAMLDGRVDDVELGAILMAYRIKGETPDELAGMLSAAHERIVRIQAPDGPCRAVSIPSYNGARKQPNLVPLLAALLAARGVPVVVHGVVTDAGRVTSAAIFDAMGIPASRTPEQASSQLAQRHVVFVPIEVLSPQLARLLQMRRRMGVRNSTHTLVKLLDPLRHAHGAGGIRLVNYTHPPYRDSLAGLFTAHSDIASGDILLARGTEGEAVADTRRQVQVDRVRDGRLDTITPAARSPLGAPAPDLPDTMAADMTAAWIAAALKDPRRVPAAILDQVETIAAIAMNSHHPAPADGIS